MSLTDKLTYHLWNIGFVDAPTLEVINARNSVVRWMKHPHSTTFFADPFILDHDENNIKVLVEEFPYRKRKGVISLLDISREDVSLKSKRILLDMPYHQSYPFILRTDDGRMQVLPEASQSGALWIYDWDGENLVNRRKLIDMPLLDSTIVQHDGRWWLFATQRGEGSNRDLFVFVSDFPDKGYELISNEPVKSDLSSSRPAGYVIKTDSGLVRTTQDCSVTYGGGVNLTVIDDLSPNGFSEHILDPVEVNLGDFNEAFHTINEYNGLTVVDGVKSYFRPVSKIYNTLLSKIHK